MNEREATLSEYLEKLPAGHQARDQYNELIDNIESLQRKIKMLGDTKLERPFAGKVTVKYESKESFNKLMDLLMCDAIDIGKCNIVLGEE